MQRGELAMASMRGFLLTVLSLLQPDCLPEEVGSGRQVCEEICS